MPTIKALIIEVMSDYKQRHYRDITDLIIAKGATFNHKSKRSNAAATVSSIMSREKDIFIALGGGVYKMRRDYKESAAKKKVSRSSSNQKIKNESAHTEPKPEKLPTPKLWKSELFIAQKGICNGCCDVFNEKHLVIDHKIPKAKGGTDHYDNLQLLCGNCNQSKGNRTMQEWKENTNWFLNVVEAHLKHGVEYVKKADADAELAEIARQIAKIK